MEKLSVIVTGHRVMEDGSISVLCKDKISTSNPLRRLAKENAATRSGSFWINKGNSLDVVREAYPVGQVITDANWGEVIDSKIAAAQGKLFSIVFDEELVTEGE